MSDNYKVKVNNSSEYLLTKDDLLKLDIVDFNNSKHHVLQGNKSFHTEIVESNFNAKKYVVKVNNTKYKVSIQNELDLLITKMGFEVGQSKIINEIKAPMPGLILDITVKIGQEVKENDSLLVLEAMKMENNITSPRDGVIKSILAKKGDAVDKGELLIEFE